MGYSSVSLDITLLYLLAETLYDIYKSSPAHQRANFQTTRMKIIQIPCVIFQTTSQFFFNYDITLQCHDT